MVSSSRMASRLRLKLVLESFAPSTGSSQLTCGDMPLVEVHDCRMVLRLAGIADRSSQIVEIRDDGTRASAGSPPESCFEHKEKEAEACDPRQEDDGKKRDRPLSRRRAHRAEAGGCSFGASRGCG